MKAVASNYSVVRHCPRCGPRTVRSPEENLRRPDTIPCPTCGLDPAEYAYIERILADSAGVYAEEHRAYQAERRAS